MSRGMIYFCIDNHYGSILAPVQGMLYSENICMALLASIKHAVALWSQLG